MKLLLTLAALTCVPAFAETCPNPPQTATAVNLERYVGTWYEVEAIPQSFQKGCSNTRATYTALENGKIDVLNECKRDGNWTNAHGQATVVDKETNAKLKVSFVWPYIGFFGDYWILDVDADYQVAVVGHPCRESGWILSRNPHTPDFLIDNARIVLKEQGYDLSKFVQTQHDN